MLYFDHNATSPLCAPAREAWLAACDEFIGNPSSPHRLGARAATALDRAREQLSTLLSCEADEIVWTSGATESLNTAVKHLSEVTEGEAWVSAIEHPSVLAPVRRHFRGRHKLLPVLPTGVLDTGRFAEEVKASRPACVALMAANNETGVLQPWREVLAHCCERDVPFICDAAQWVGKLPAEGLGAAAFVAGCAHKFGGPPGVGFLKCSRDTRRFITGGPQEDGRRAGTENVPGVLAMMAALADREARMRDGQVVDREGLRAEFEHGVSRALPKARTVGEGVARLWNTVLLLMPEPNTRHRYIVKLDALGFAVSSGSACASGKEAPSHVLTAMGVGELEASRAVRFTSGWDTQPGDWAELLSGLERAALET